MPIFSFHYNGKGWIVEFLNPRYYRDERDGVEVPGWYGTDIVAYIPTPK